jgi:hypothetical protein
MKSIRPTQHYDLCEVVWDDAAGLRLGWSAKHEQLVPQIALSVGFLIVDTPTHIIIAQDTDGEGSHNGRTQIPRGMVKKMKVLRKKDETKVDDAKSRTPAGAPTGSG